MGDRSLLSNIMGAGGIVTAIRCLVSVYSACVYVVFPVLRYTIYKHTYTTYAYKMNNGKRAAKFHFWKSDIFFGFSIFPFPLYSYLYSEFTEMENLIK